LRSGATIRQEPCEGRIGNTAEHGDAAGVRRNATPKGPGLLRRGFVERLARIADTGCAFLLPTTQNPSGAAVQSGPNLLSLVLARNPA